MSDLKLIDPTLPVLLPIAIGLYTSQQVYDLGIHLTEGPRHPDNDLYFPLTWQALDTETKLGWIEYARREIVKLD